jgi:hypothetical protein
MAFEVSATSFTVTPVEFHERAISESMCCRISDRNKMFVPKNGWLQSCERAATAGSDAGRMSQEIDNKMRELQI